MKRRKRRIMAILLAFAMIFTMVDPSIFGGAITVQAEEVNTDGNSYKETGNGWSTDGNTYYIQDVSNLEYVVEHYDDVDDVGPQLRKARFVVTDNINLGTSAANRINIGTKDYPFTREFDGQGYTISGLKCDEEIATNGGLFGIMSDGAIIKDLIIDNASIRSNHYGGILAAQAKDAIIQNVTIKNSKCKIASFGAVIGLITTGGLYGGALVGYANNTKIYNCESRNTVVEVDTVGGVQALGGDGMYMGGLVGWMDNGSIIEYSRVIGGTEGKVETKYEIAVGALAANNLYAGGIVGRLDGNGSALTQILDCFSDTYVNFHGANYVSVGSGISGYAGGIAARVSGSNYEMERCHYAGKLSSYLLNSVLVLPVIPMEDYYLGGIAGNVEDSSKIHNCYFNWEKAIQDNTRKKVPAIYSESNRGDVTTIGDAQYSNSTFFVGFDFDGTDEANLRNTNNNELLGGAHYNKWVINRDTNMPVHGNIVYAETDFPGAGTISFAATSIQEEKKTDGWTKEENPDDELANGISISQIAQTYSDMNEEIILTATVNEGYNFKGWSVRRDGVEIELPTEQYGSQEEDYKLVLGGDSTSKYEYEDGDVYVARYTANVLFRNIDDTDNYYSRECTYQQVVDPSRVNPNHPDYVFLGWTQTKPTGELDKDQLTTVNIEKTGLIEEDITITVPITLYPVFILIGNYNVQVQMESAPLEDGNNKGKVGNEGTAVVKTNENGDLFLTIDENMNDDGESIITESNGYRFDGWYKLDLDENENVQLDSNGKAKGTLVSRSKTYYLTEGLDEPQRYEARYQYSVESYFPIKESSTASYIQYLSEGYLGETYVGYGEGVDSVPRPQLNSEHVTFKYWETKEGINVNKKYTKDEMNTLANKDEILWPDIKITEPTEIYAVIRLDIGLNQIPTYQPITVKTDFSAGAERLELEECQSYIPLSQNGYLQVGITVKDGYNLKGFWQYYKYEDGWKQRDSSRQTPNLTISEDKKTTSWKSGEGYYFGETHVVVGLTANINFHYDVNNVNNIKTIERKYNSRIFNEMESEDGTVQVLETEDWDSTDDNVHLQSPIYSAPGDAPAGTGNTIELGLTNEDMYRSGYQFQGWTTADPNTTDLFNVSGEPFVTDSIAKAAGYVLDNDLARVTQTMELYPVYVKYDINTYTNFSNSELLSTNQPEKPAYTVTDDGTVTLKLSSIPKDLDSEERYEFKGWHVESKDGVEDLDITWNKEDNTYSLKVVPAKRYDIYAEYDAIVSFKNANGEKSDIDKMYEYGEEYGELPVAKLPVGSETIIKPGESVNNTDVFVGWKDLIISDDSSMEDGRINCSQTEVAKYPFVSKDKKVEGAVNLWPVYTKPSISLESNIGVGSDATINISEEGIVTLEAPEQEGYVFTGWSLNGEPFAEEDIYTLSPEELRSDEPYKFTANYDVLVTYMIPNVNENNELTGKYTPMQAPIPMRTAIGDGQYSVAPTIAAMSALEKAGYIFGGWAKEGESTEYTSEITEPITLYPLTNQAKISMYSNIDDVVDTIIVSQEDGKIKFPGESELSLNKGKLPDGISMTSKGDTNIETSFIGYSLVEITTDKQGNEVSRTSKALYKAGDSIPAKELSAYNSTGNYRIYAVWSQIQNISEASIYLDESNSHEGLCTAAAVNTKILRNAGLQDSEAKYERHILYSKGTKYTDIKTTNGTDWNNTLYQEYFDKDYDVVADENWDVYVSLLYNIQDNTQEYGVCPYLKFFYTSEKQGNFRDKTDPTWKHNLKDVAKNLLGKTDKEEYSWYKYEDTIKRYAGIE